MIFINTATTSTEAKTKSTVQGSYGQEKSGKTVFLESQEKSGNLVET